MDNILKEAVQTAYRKGGEAAYSHGVTKATVKNLKFPEDSAEPGEKKGYPGSR